MQKRYVKSEDLLALKIINDPQISSDGKRVIFTAKTIDADKNRYRSHLHIGQISSGKVWQFTHGEVNDTQPRWSPDNEQIAFLRDKDAESQIWLIPANGGEAQQLTQIAEGDLGAFAWDPKGTRLAFEFRPTHPEWTQSARQERENLGCSDPPRQITRLHYRREGQGYFDCNQHIYICDVSNGEVQQITTGDWDDRNPIWSPDGEHIAFLSNRSADPVAQPYAEDLWLLSAKGGSPQKIPTPNGYKWGLSWSPDGQYIAYLGSETQNDPWMARNDNLWIVSLRDHQTQCLTASLDRTIENVTLSDVRGVGNQDPVWAADSRRLFFLASDQGNCHLYTTTLAGDPAPLTDQAFDIAGFSIDTVGKRIALLIGHPTQPGEIYQARMRKNTQAGIELKQISHLNQRWLEDVQPGQPEEIWFQSSDGTKIQGWLLKPSNFDTSRQYPVVLYIHGGPAAQYGNTFFHEFQALAAQGYLLLYTNPRGSLGREETFATCIQGNWGELDYQDLMAAKDYATSLPFVDTSRMAVVGGSYGGFMATWIVGHTNCFRCAITERGVSNRHSAVGTSDFSPMPDGYWPGNAWEQPELLWQQSSLRLANKIKTPLLIIHSEGDWRCTIDQAEQLFSALKRLKREVLFLRYPSQTSHGFSRNGPPDLRIDRLQRIVAWLDKHLKDDHQTAGAQT